MKFKNIALAFLGFLIFFSVGLFVPLSIVNGISTNTLQWVMLISFFLSSVALVSNLIAYGQLKEVSPNNYLSSSPMFMVNEKDIDIQELVNLLESNFGEELTIKDSNGRIKVRGKKTELTVVKDGSNLRFVFGSNFFRIIPDLGNNHKKMLIVKTLIEAY